MKKANEKFIYSVASEKGEFTVRTLETGKDWLNILWNDVGYQTVISHTGATTSGRVTESSERINLNENKSGLIYLRDDDTGEYFSPGGYPCGVMPNDFMCTHAQAYSEISGEKFGIAANVTYAVHPEKLCELKRATLKNLTADCKNVSVFALVVFDLAGYPMPFYYNAPTTSVTEFVPKANAVLCASQNPYGNMEEKSGFIACSQVPQYVCGDLDSFTGLCGSLSAPRVLSQGENLSGDMATVRSRCGILQHKFKLAAGESKTLYYSAGFVKDKAELIGLNKLLENEYERLFDNIMHNSAKEFSGLKTESPSEQVNTVLNFWALKQVSFCCIGKKAVRDNAQLAVALLDFAPEDSKKTIIECLEHQYADGHAMLLWYPIVEKTLYSDPAFWLIWAITEYLKETGDFGFLDEKYDFYDGGKASVREHVEAGLRWYENPETYGPHGLPKIYHADWNDALNIPDENAESVLMAMLVCYLFGETAKLYAHLKEPRKEKELLTAKKRLAAAVNESAWNGEYYVRAISEFGNVGDKGCEGGEFYFNPQSWAVMADIVPAERLPALLKSIDKYETDEGVPMCVPPYPRYDESVGRMSGMLPGVYENGGIYNHAGCFKVMADCALGRKENAANTFLKILPNGRKNPSEITGLEPYVFSNCYLKHPSVDMKVASSWQTGTSAWGLRCYYDGILGLVRTFEGLKITPCLPPDWKRVTASRVYRGKKLDFEYQNDGVDKVILLLDGKQTDGDTLKSEMLKDGMKVTVKIVSSEKKP